MSLTVEDAIAIAWNAKRIGDPSAPRPTLDEARGYFEQTLTSIGHSWLTGAACVSLLQAAIERRKS